MDTKIATAKYRSAQWMEIIRDRQNSGLNVKDYCQIKGLSRHAYYYWQRKLRESACAELAKQEDPVALIPTGWAQLTTETTVSSSLEIEVVGCRININYDTDPELLKKVCRILRSL